MKHIKRIDNIYRPAQERLRDYGEVERVFTKEELAEQAVRCLSCGIPFCHGIGCPLGNVIPEMTAAASKGNWKEAWEILSATSPFPEFTGRVCPALCENACTNNIENAPVMIRQLEKAITENAFQKGYVRPFYKMYTNGKTVAVIGSGPAGLAAANYLTSQGHHVTVFEKNAKPGGLLRYGIPDFKLDKNVIDRRINVMKSSGISFICSTVIGKDISAEYVLKTFDAVIVAIGTPAARDLAIPGRELTGIYQALDFLAGQNRAVSGEMPLPISAKGKTVVVIGGGDTGSDCVGTALRQGAESVTQIDIIPEPPARRSNATPWPDWPYALTSSSSHKEGGRRLWSVASKSFIGHNGQITAIDTVPLEWEYTPEGRPVKFKECGSHQELKADLVLLAMGFTGVSQSPLTDSLMLEIDSRGRLIGDPTRGIFTCGDTRTGQSLVVRAISDAINISKNIDSYLSM